MGASNYKNHQITSASANHDQEQLSPQAQVSVTVNLSLPFPPCSDRQREAMASPQACLLEMLQLPGVSRETGAVLTSLLRKCVDDHNLSEYVLKCVTETIQTQDQGFNLVSLFTSESCACSPPLAGSVLPRTQLVGLVAESLNDEAARWMSDFLLIAIGKRNHQHTMSPSHPFARQHVPERCILARHGIDELQDLVCLLSEWLASHTRLRDGLHCSISGSIHSVVCSQLIQLSDDIGRIARFRVLARIFFQEDVPSLSDAQLQSTENALRLSMYWKDRLDKGCLFFRCIDGEFHAVPASRDDSDTLAEERQSNGLQGPTLLEIHGGVSTHKYPRLNSQLAWVHQVITETWLETGLANRLLNDIDWVNSLPKSMQSVSILGPRGFNSLLKHRLMIM